MCGIAGILNLERHSPPTLEQATAMIAIFRYRGPNESGIFLDDDAALGHVRLSIIGIDDGIQPISNETGTRWIVYNGEAFNYLELKEELARRGHRFRTGTDTEVVLHLYEEYGPQCLEMINGQFALAIWDSVSRELFLARDRVGIRPLYYTLSKGKLLFASEMKSIFAVDGTRPLDLEGLAQVFTFWTTVHGKTVFSGIQELPPGHFMFVKDGTPSVKRYWSIPCCEEERACKPAPADAAAQLRELLTDAIRLRLRADVPVGAYLSGGLDSSIITTLIATRFDRTLRTFSMSFQEEAFDESSYQQELVHTLGLDHRSVLIDNGKIRELFPKAVWHCETPLLRTAPVPLLILSGLVHAEKFRVVLSGEGADEVFGGYNIFKEAKVRNFWAKIPDSKIRPLLLERLYPYVFRDPARGRHFLRNFFKVAPSDRDNLLFSHMIRWENSRKNLMFLTDECRDALAGYDPLAELVRGLPENFQDRDLLARAQVLEMETFLANYLLSSQGDRVAMANSVEVRHPFLDYRVIDFAFRLPPNLKINGMNEKYLLKLAFGGVVPDRIRHRGKTPYRAPIRELFNANAPADYVDDLLSERAIKRSGYFDAGKVRRLFEKFRTTDNRHPGEFQNMALIGILSTQLLHRQFVEGFPDRPAERLIADRVICRYSNYARGPGKFAPPGEGSWKHAAT